MPLHEPYRKRSVWSMTPMTAPSTQLTPSIPAAETTQHNPRTKKKRRTVTDTRLVLIHQATGPFKHETKTYETGPVWPSGMEALQPESRCDEDSRF
jgi:hypothetical protein